MILQAVVGGFVLDALFGDPAWLPHPVVLMGRFSVHTSETRSDSYR